MKGKANTIKSTFSRETTVSIDIQSDSKRIWSLLTNAQNYSNWNSTVLSIEGKIALGEKIQLRSYLDPKRVFKLTVKEVEAEKRLVWGDAMGKREYKLTPSASG
ncbi:MAG TPA: SRPBCC domain-containing protein, partial [Bacteroidia bacterium]|nr:SRPBCC domain-containing protein [Bacteroidia bacterium]